MPFSHLVGARSEPRRPQLSIFIILETKPGHAQHTSCRPPAAIVRVVIPVEAILDQTVVAAAQAEEGGAQVPPIVGAEEPVLAELPHRHGAAAFGGGDSRDIAGADVADTAFVPAEPHPGVELLID